MLQIPHRNGSPAQRALSSAPKQKRGKHTKTSQQDSIRDFDNPHSSPSATSFRTFVREKHIQNKHQHRTKTRQSLLQKTFSMKYFFVQGVLFKSSTLIVLLHNLFYSFVPYGLYFFFFLFFKIILEFTHAFCFFDYHLTPIIVPMHLRILMLLFFFF